mgnify:CR=1 FL=1
MGETQLILELRKQNFHLLIYNSGTKILFKNVHNEKQLEEILAKFNLKSLILEMDIKICPKIENFFRKKLNLVELYQTVQNIELSGKKITRE